MNLPIEKSELNVNCGKDDQRKGDYLITTMITNDPIDGNNNTESKKGKKINVNGDVINMITDPNHESDEVDDMDEEEDDLLSSSMNRTSSRHHERLSASLIADDEEASGHSGNTQGYYELDERRTKKRRKQSNPVRYGNTGILAKTSSSRPFKNPGEDYEEDDVSRDQTDNFVHNSNNEDESMMVDDNSSSVLRMTIGRSSTIHRTNALKRRFGKITCAEDGEETEEDDGTDEAEDEEDEGMDEPIEGDEDDEEPGQMDLSVAAAAAAAAAALNYSQLAKFHFLCPHCGCPFINEDQLKNHIEEEHVQKVLEQQLLHHQQQQQQLDSQHPQQYRKTPNGISSRQEPKHGPFLDGPASRGQQQTRSRLSSSNRDVDAELASSLGDSCSNSPLGSPNCRQKTFDSPSLGSNNNDHHSHHLHSHSQHHGSSSSHHHHHSTSHHKSSSKHSMTITGVSGTNNNKNSGANSSTAGVTPVPSGSAKDFATLLSYKLHGVSGQQSTPTTSSSSPSTGNHHHHNHHPSSTTSQLPVPHSSASQSGQLNCDDNSSNNNGKDNNNNSSSNVMPIAMFPYLFNILPGSNGSNCSNNSTSGNNNNLNNGSLVGGNGAGVNLTSGAIHNGLGLAGLTAINPANVHQKIFNPEAYCELCNKELCNKYFLKTHKANKHGIYTSDPSPTGPGGSSSSSTAVTGSGSQAAQAAAVAAALNTAAAAAYFQSAGGIPSGSAQAAAAMQMQQLFQQASSGSNGGAGPGGNGTGSASGTPSIDSSNAAAMVALATRSVGMINMESYCDICQKQFCNKYFLKKHRSKIHNIHCSSSSSTSSVSGNNNNTLMLTGPGSGFHGSNDHSVTSLANLTGLAMTAGSSSLDRNILNRSVSPTDSSDQGGDSNGLTEAISLVSTKVPSGSPQLSPSPSMGHHQSTPLTINDINSQSGPLKMTSSSSSSLTTTTTTMTTTTTTITTGNNLVSNDRDRLSSKQVIPSSIQSSSVNSSPSSSPSTTITTVSASNCLPNNNNNNNNNNSNCETYCDLCRTDLGNPMALQAHRMIIHSIAPQGSPSSSLTRDQFQAMMASFHAESALAFLGRPINIPAGENIIFTTEKLREMGVINTDAFCEICKREFCNKYFLRTHKANKHGIGTIDTASNCGSTKSNASGHHKGEGKEDGSHREEREGESERGTRIPHDFSYSERQSISCPEDNTMSPRSSANEDSNQRRPSPSSSPTDLIFTSSHVTITPTTPTGDSLRASSVSPTRTSSSPQVTLSAVNTSSNQGNNNNNPVSPGNGIPMTINSDCELICEICGKNFQSKSSLRAHRINIHGIRNNNNSINCLPGRTGSSSAGNCTSNRRDIDNKSPESPKNCLSMGNNNNSNQVSVAAFALTGRQFGMDGLMTVKCGTSGGSNSSGSSRPSGNCRNYCNICNKELCNKYFMKTHMKKMHQIDIDEHPAEAAFTSTIGGVTCDICHKELCSKYFLKVHKQNTHGIGEDTPGGMKDGSRVGLADMTGPGMNLLIPGASGLVAGLSSNLSNNVLTTSSSPSPLGSHHHHHHLHPHHQTGGSTTTNSGGVDGSGKRGDSNRVGMDGIMDCSSGLTSDTENSVGIDPTDTGNRYFSHYTEVCPLCERRFKSIKWLKTHMTNDHSDLIPIRPSGNGSSSSSTFPLLNNAELTASAFLSSHDLSRMCVMCGQICSDRPALQMHLIKDHKTSPEELATLTGTNLFGLSNFNDIASEATDLSSPINKSSNNSSSNNTNNNNNSSNNKNTRNINNNNNLKSNDNNSNEMKPMLPTSSPPSESHETSSLPDNLMNQLGGSSIHKHDPMEAVKEEVVTLSQTLQAARTRMKELRLDLEREKNAHAITKDKLAQHGSELHNLRNSLQLVIEQQRLEVKTLQAKLKELDADLQNRHMALQRMEKENIHLKLTLQQMDTQKSNLENLPLLHNEIDRLRAELSQTETHAHAVQQTNDELLRNIDKLSEQFTE